MKKFNNETIRLWGACYDPKKYFTDDQSHTVLSILDDKRISFDDRLWVVLRTDLISEKMMRLFAVWSARQVQHLMKDERSIKAIDIAEAFANGNATNEDLAAARAAARAAAWDAARAAARAAAWAAARDAAWDAARAAAWAAARAAARDDQENKLREMIITGIETGDTK